MGGRKANYNRSANERAQGPGGRTKIQDVWRPDEHQSEGRKVDDPRIGKLTCRKCGQEVTTVQVGGKWSTRNLDGTPHALTCG